MTCDMPTPTVALSVAIPVPLSKGGWAWGEHPRFAGVLAEEYAYDGREMCALVRAYAVTLARLIRPSEASRFTVMARGLVTGVAVARDEWQWSEGRHAFRPTGDPWDTSRAAIKRYWELTGELFTRRRFCLTHDHYATEHANDPRAGNAVRMLPADRQGARPDDQDRDQGGTDSHAA